MRSFIAILALFSAAATAGPIAHTEQRSPQAQDWQDERDREMLENFVPWTQEQIDAWFNREDKFVCAFQCFKKRDVAVPHPYGCYNPGEESCGNGEHIGQRCLPLEDGSGLGVVQIDPNFLCEEK